MTTAVNPILSKTIYVLAAITAIAITFGIYTSQKKAAEQQAMPQAHAAQPGALASLKPHVDLGSISMKAGNVSFGYLIKNTAATPITINRIFTSCMCTNATLVTGKERKGPFGMPGHGGSSTLKTVLAAGEMANLEVVFDPAAHGPSGLGRIERFVTVERSESTTLELHMTVLVRP
jgi:hypothetical protein